MAVGLTMDGAVAELLLDHPPANGYDLRFLEELDGALDEVAAGGARVVVVRSALPRFFSAGADIRSFAAGTVEDNMALIRTAHRAFDRMAAMPQVFVAEITGHALGGGLELALACDVRFAADGVYRIGLPEVTLGLLPGNGGTQRLPGLVGWGRALELMVTGRTLTPAEALALGLVEALHPAEELGDVTTGWARSVAGGAPLAVAAVKRAVRDGTALPARDGLRLEQDLIEGLFRSADAAEGLRAFLEKRPPRWRGS